MKHSGELYSPSPWFISYSRFTLLQSNVKTIEMLHLWLRACVENFFLTNRLSHFTRFWDWIKCRVSDGLLYRLSLEPAARLMNQFSILIPSFNAHKYVYPICWVPKKEFFYLKLPKSSIKKSKEEYVFDHLRPSLIVFISLQKTNTNFRVSTYPEICSSLK